MRVSGPQCRAIAKAVLGALPEPRRATHCDFLDARGERLDEGLALYFQAPHSYTGEPSSNCRATAAPVVMQAVLAAVLDAGARLAEPGEFTRRAFLNGKLDLAQAEAVADLIDAASREAARSALRSLAGEFSAAIAGAGRRAHRAARAHRGDARFPGGRGRQPAPRATPAERLARLRASLEDVLAKSRQGSLLRSGIHAVLAGRPNVGKSSLLNRLAGEERAIVTAVPGTTRDALREAIQIEGVPIVVVDTAGLRESRDEVERLGMARTRSEMERADVVLVVLEAGKLEAPPGPLPAAAARITVVNKIDLVAGAAAGRQGERDPRFGEDRRRPGRAAQRDARSGGLERARRDGVPRARAALARARTRRAAIWRLPRRRIAQWEFFAEELRLAQEALGEITGRVSADDLLGEIFARFCIGK